MRGFDRSEFIARVAKAQSLMWANGIDALLLTTEQNLRYFTGYLTRFWESPSRPWFLIVPQSGDPVAVIPSIGAALMAKTWIADIRTWSAPDLLDDGVSLLAQTLSEVLGQGARIGVLGEVHPGVRKRFKLGKARPIYIELEEGALFEVNAPLS